MSFKKTGVVLGQLTTDLKETLAHTSYVTRDFCQSTILYARGGNSKQKEVEYVKIRPCDQEDFISGIEQEDDTIRIKFEDIPKSNLELIDPEYRPSPVNAAFMFNEGEKDQEIFFIDRMATHTMHRLPIASKQAFTYRAACLLAENLLHYGKFSAPDDSDFLEGEIVDDVTVQVPCEVTMIIKKKEDKPVIVGFMSAQDKIPVTEYVDSFINALNTKGSLLYYEMTDQNITILMTPSTINRVKDAVPCIKLTVSDCGYGAPSLAYGWATKQADDNYLFSQSELKELTSDSSEKLIDEIEERVADFLVALTNQQTVLSEMDNISYSFTEPGESTFFASSLFSKMPKRAKMIGDKAYNKLLAAFEDEVDHSELTELSARTTLIGMVYDYAPKAYSRVQLSNTAGAALLGI